MISFDVSRFPLVVIKTEGEFTAADAVHCEDTLQSLYERQRRFALVCVCADLVMPQTRIVRRLSQWLRDTRDKRERWTIGVAVHVDSPVVNKALGFFNTLAPCPAPQEVFTSEAEAMLWAKDMIDADIPLFESRTGS